jgi:hypothetical protein
LSTLVAELNRLVFTIKFSIVLLIKNVQILF